MRTRAATLDDVEELVRVHQESFQGFFLTRLGPAFLRELYRSFVVDPDAICLTAQDEQRILGFVVGALHPSSFFKKLLLRRWYAFTIAAVPALVRQPHVVARRLASALFYRGTEPKGKPGGALLSSLAVSPTAAGKGVGSALVQEFCGAARERHASFVYLTTDRDHNETVNRFYQKAGFYLECSFQSHRRWMNMYARNVS